MADLRLRERLRSALREPLTQVLLIGLAIFLFFGAFGGTANVWDRRITIDEAQVKQLAAQWTQTWQRPPTPAELDGLIRDYIKDEIYYREALRLGLDKDDMVVRRRLRAKMEFLATSETENMVASDAELQAWLDKNPARYASDPVYSLDQVYVSAADGETAAIAKARILLTRLQAGASPDNLGDPISLPRRLDAASSFEINRQFGEDFTGALKALPTGTWTGPVASGFGLHLVRIRSVAATRKPKLAEVRQAVENDWRAATQESREAKAYQALLDGYQIDIVRPK